MTMRRSCSLQQIRRMITVSRPTLFDVVNPATGKTIAELPDDSPQDVAEKFQRLSGGQRRWNDVPVFERRETLERFNELLRLNMNSLAQILTSEMGKPIKQSKNEIRATVDRVKFYLTHYEKVLREHTVLETARLKEKVVYEPLGVIANISAWNYPYFVSANVFAAALLTGNTVLYKPSEYASLSGQEITRLLHEAGVPKDAFMLCTGKGETGSAVSSLEGLGGIFFTGSFKTGLEIAKTAAPNLVKVQLELGGKDPVYVRHDVPNVASAAASIADGAFYNCGQSCCSVERIYVDKKIYPEFVENFVKTVKSFKMGDPLSDETYIGPVARKPQIPFLASQVIDALRKGASAAVGGDMTNVEDIPRAGFWFPPTVLTDVNHTMNVMREESFGPLIGIQMVDGDAEALNLMRDTPYGLTASVFCKSSSDAEAILRELEVGTGYWNCCDRVSPRLPWSGRKASGIGATLGMDGLRSFVQPKGFFLQRPC
ncbi:hypothetical protein MPTK1_2g10740 [Marchantia polymorpha subsp. ruderalis]|uniref:Aldehyde dehydrogenase domain-containing protein n=1 Tax=Marchantia polymorpha TaxID=3197 RepID=A0A2R6XCG4_MARPO|nr:hypothetical protein MARPO_0023s0041 [Marchantia polymorpha]BBN01846.1 hypothetical protein Mp_2g10740 [Marchantia polymorpha subsp. ruderalis]|eukprot:PTQ43709.1 hypothetical protein MARPO_0023s0041 [Marchantia polymorpha]